MLTINLDSKTAVVTGAGQGIGLATAKLLYEAGANVVINFFDEPSGLNRIKAERAAAELGMRAVAVAADVRDASAVDRLFESVAERFGAVDILVNSAGILRDRTLKKIEREDWDAVIETNLTGVFNTCKAVSTRMAEGGRIVNLASISAVLGFYGQMNYAAAKCGVIGITRVLSRELAKYHITVNAVAPGVVLTEMGQSIPDTARNEMLLQIPMKRFGEPDEIASVILFLCSPLASYMTGQTVHVNGGWWG